MQCWRTRTAWAGTVAGYYLPNDPGARPGWQFEHPVVGGCGDVDAAGGVCRQRPGLEQTRRRQLDAGARPGWQFEHPVVGGSEEPRRSLAPRMRMRRTANMGFCPAASPTAPRSCYARGMPRICGIVA